MRAYRLLADKNLDIVNESFLYDVDDDFTSKQDYIKQAKDYTKRINKEYGTNYTYEKIFGEPKYEGWCYCKRCGEFYWEDEGCECDE